MSAELRAWLFGVGSAALFVGSWALWRWGMRRGGFWGSPESPIPMVCIMMVGVGFALTMLAGVGR